MAAPIDEPPNQGALSLLKWIDGVASRFESAWLNWQSGAPPSIENYLSDASSSHRVALLRELVLIDVEFRERHAMPRRWLDYAEDFPELRPWRLDSQVPGQSLPSRAQRVSAVLAETSPRNPPDSEDEEHPKTIGRYRIVEVLPPGGQADLYRAVHPTLRRDVVIKLLRIQVADDPVHHDLLVSEGRVLAELDHPNIARVYDADLWQGRPFLVIEHVRGRTLEQYATDVSPPAQVSAAIVSNLARAVATAHKRGVVHQDITPRNVLMDEHAQPRLIDFGLAVLKNAWREGPAIPGGTPIYMSPEQARGESDHIGPATDVFGLGAILYFLLTGQAPYSERDALAAVERTGRGDYDREALRICAAPRSLKSICQRSLASQASERFGTADEMAQALDRATRRPVVVRRAIVGMTIAMVLTALVCAWTFWLRPLPPSELPGPALVNGGLDVNVLRGMDSIPLEAAVPLGADEMLSVRLRVPAGVHASVFGINGQGQVNELTYLEPQQDDVAPPLPVVLRGPRGTEVLLLCFRREGRVAKAEIDALWDGDRGLPTLPNKTIFLIDRERVRPVNRDIVPIGRDSGPDATEMVYQRLNRLRRRLAAECDDVRGLVFAH